MIFSSSSLPPVGLLESNVVTFIATAGKGGITRFAKFILAAGACSFGGASSFLPNACAIF